jgi:hypothetical protein
MTRPRWQNLNGVWDLHRAGGSGVNRVAIDGEHGRFGLKSSNHMWFEADGAFQTVISQDGPSNSDFFLQYSGADQKFAMSFAGVRALAPFKPAVGQWYHLVGVRDTVKGELRLYVDGALAGTASACLPQAGADRRHGDRSCTTRDSDHHRAGPSAGRREMVHSINRQPERPALSAFPTGRSSWPASSAPFIRVAETAEQAAMAQLIVVRPAIALLRSGGWQESQPETRTGPGEKWTATSSTASGTLPRP